MSAIVMWIVWAALALILLIILGYRASITRYEEDQMFLNSSEDIQQREQASVLAKVDRVRPLMWTSVTATCVMSAILIIYYVWGAFRNFS